MIAACLAIAALAALLAYREYAHAQERKDFAAERLAYISERENLSQRIQAPQAAVVEHALENYDPPKPIPFDDDAAFWASVRQ